MPIKGTDGMKITTEMFTEAFITALQNKGLDCQTPEDILLAKKQYNQLKGLFSEIGEILGITQNQAKDYYNNKWVLQFYQNLKPYRSYIKQIVQTNLSKDIDNICKIVNWHLADVKINQRSLKQMICVLVREFNKKTFSQLKQLLKGEQFPIMFHEIEIKIDNNMIQYTTPLVEKNENVLNMVTPKVTTKEKENIYIDTVSQVKPDMEQQKEYSETTSFFNLDEDQYQTQYFDLI